MGIISATFIGLIVGTIAKFLMPGGSGGWIITILFVRDVPMNEPAMPITVDLPRMGGPADFIGSTVARRFSFYSTGSSSNHARGPRALSHD